MSRLEFRQLGQKEGDELTIAVRQALLHNSDVVMVSTETAGQVLAAVMTLGLMMKRNSSLTGLFEGCANILDAAGLFDFAGPVYEDYDAKLYSSGDDSGGSNSVADSDQQHSDVDSTPSESGSNDRIVDHRRFGVSV